MDISMLTGHRATELAMKNSQAHTQIKLILSVRIPRATSRLTYHQLSLQVR